MELEKLLNSKIGSKLVMIGKISKIFAIQTFADKNFEITPEQFLVLSTLVENDGLYQRQISSITLKDRPNISRILDILEKKEFIKRVDAVSTRKVFKIYITEKGREIYEKILPTIIKIWQETIKGINEKDLETTLKVLQQFGENMIDKIKMQM